MSIQVSPTITVRIDHKKVGAWQHETSVSIGGEMVALRWTKSDDKIDLEIDDYGIKGIQIMGSETNDGLLATAFDRPLTELLKLADEVGRAESDRRNNVDRAEDEAKPKPKIGIW